MTALTGRARVLADAAARGPEIEVIEHSAADSLEQAAELLGIETRQIVTSRVVRRHTPEGEPHEYLFVPIPGDRQISSARLRGVVGVNTLSLPSAELALEATDCQRGTITPLGGSVARPVFEDASMVGSRWGRRVPDVSNGGLTRSTHVFVEWGNPSERPFRVRIGDDDRRAGGRLVSRPSGIRHAPLVDGCLLDGTFHTPALATGAPRRHRHDA